MTHRLTTNYAKNYCNRTLIIKVIVENVVTCFLGHGVVVDRDNLNSKLHFCDVYLMFLTAYNELNCVAPFLFFG